MQISGGSARTALADGTLTTLLTGTRFGRVWLCRAVLLLAVAPMLLSTARQIAWLRLLIVASLLASIALVGHSNTRTDSIGWLQLGGDMAHLLAAGLWLGSLPALALLLASESEGAPQATRRFSSFGMAAVAILLLTGLFNAYLLTDSILAWPDSEYGRLLLLKIALFAAMLAIAAINRFYWTPQLPNRRAIVTLRRHALVEASLGLIVILAVGALGTLPPPLHAHLQAGAGDEGAFVHIHDIAAMAEVRLLPGTAGPNTAEIRLMREDFGPLAANSVRLRLSRTGQTSISQDASASEDGLWRVPSVPLPTPGVWTVLVQVRTEGKAPLALDGPIVVAPGSPAKSE
jgi:putative copper export protein